MKRITMRIAAVGDSLVWAQSVRILAVALVCGCGVEVNPDFDGDGTAQETSVTEGPPPATTTGPGPGPQTDASDSQDSASGGSETSDEPPVEEGTCWDDVSQPGELCFQEQTLLVGKPSLSIAVADPNDDGTPDLVVGHTFGGTVYIGVGQGKFTIGGYLETFGNGVVNITSADVDGSGYPDIITTLGPAAVVAVYYSNPIPDPFSTWSTNTFGGELDGVVAWDMFADGTTELLIAAPFPENLLVLQEIQGTIAVLGELDVGLSPHGPYAGDFNGDGLPEIVITNRVTNEIRVLPNLGTDLGPPDTYVVCVEPIPVAMGDFNNDDITDLAVGCVGSSEIDLLRGVGDGTFMWELALFAEIPVYILASGDFNSDGFLDLVAADGEERAVRILFGNGGFEFSMYWWDLYATPSQFAVADLNADGVDDLAVASSGVLGGLSVLLSHP